MINGMSMFRVMARFALSHIRVRAGAGADREHNNKPSTSRSGIMERKEFYFGFLRLPSTQIIAIISRL